MAKITSIEKGAFLKLFNRSGYVLDFSTNDFDIFTMESVGVALCEKYQLSKGKSLTSYCAEADEKDVIKLLSDLLSHYEIHFQDELENNKEYGDLYNKCRVIIEKIGMNLIPFISTLDDLKVKFSNDYIASQIDIMLKMQTENPTEAIGKSKELIESCCKTILESNNITPDKKWDINILIDRTTKLLKITPSDIPETVPEVKAIKSILGNLRAIASNLATIRNSYGSGHGKSSKYKGLEVRHSKLAVGSSITLVNFLWDSYERQVG